MAQNYEISRLGLNSVCRVIYLAQATIQGPVLAIALELDLAPGLAQVLLVLEVAQVLALALAPPQGLVRPAGLCPTV